MEFLDVEPGNSGASVAGHLVDVFERAVWIEPLGPVEEHIDSVDLALQAGQLAARTAMRERRARGV